MYTYPIQRISQKCRLVGDGEADGGETREKRVHASKSGSRFRHIHIIFNHSTLTVTSHNTKFDMVPYPKQLSSMLYVIRYCLLLRSISHVEEVERQLHLGCKL